MVVVSYILDSYISSLQTKASDREGHEARGVGLETMPLDQHIEGGQGEREPRLKIRPAQWRPSCDPSWHFCGPYLPGPRGVRAHRRGGHLLLGGTRGPVVPAGAPRRRRWRARNPRGGSRPSPV